MAELAGVVGVPAGGDDDGADHLFDSRAVLLHLTLNRPGMPEVFTTTRAFSRTSMRFCLCASAISPWIGFGCGSR